MVEGDRLFPFQHSIIVHNVRIPEMNHKTCTIKIPLNRCNIHPSILARSYRSRSDHSSGYEFGEGYATFESTINRRLLNVWLT